MAPPSAPKQQNKQKANSTKILLASLLMLALPFFCILFSKYTLDVAKAPVDATTHPRIREVRDRHLLWILSLFLGFNAFVSFYVLTSNYLPDMLYIVVNGAFAFALIVFASDAIRKIKEGGKAEEYKKYIQLLAGITFFAVAIVFIMLIMFIMYFRSSKGSQVKGPQVKGQVKNAPVGG